MNKSLKTPTCALTAVVPVLGERANLDRLLPDVKQALDALGVTWEVVVVNASPSDGFEAAAAAHGARYFRETDGGYGAAVTRGVFEAEGEYVLTMDPDAAEVESAVRALWNGREGYDVVVASRYVDGAQVDQPRLRNFLSRAINRFFSKVLSTPVKDLSTGFRLYRKEVFRHIEVETASLAFLLETLLKCFGNGILTVEVPFHYRLHEYRLAQAHGLKLGLECFRGLFRLWRMRNSVKCADYDIRAFDSRIFLQRYWQRTRYNIIMGFAEGDAFTLDAGCGSGRIIADLPNAVGVDIRHDKLRFMRRLNSRLAQANGLKLPFPDETFDCVISSEVIEHIPEEDGRFIDELTRVLKPGGTLVLSTPDYGTWTWPLIEWLYYKVAPNAYAHEHVTHYSLKSLGEALEARGYEIQGHGYICRSDLVYKARKRA
ncbi:MAG: methyltransferase domain-containing protein [Candidatus Hydrogenedentes bacterium]|nr:methyltransferase domain-containing protein [Candidatus Hydrogenedentota bacterium]